MPFKLVIIGLGNMGRRHLQAAVKLSGLESVIGYDVAPEIYSVVHAFIKENSLTVPDLHLEQVWESCLNQIDGNTVVIVATTAKGRAELLKKVLERYPLAVVAEKPVCQNSEELLSLREAARGTGVPVYVNLSRRSFPFYQQILHETESLGPRHVSCIFANGIARNGVHLLDLAVWLTRASSFRLIESRLDEVFDLRSTGFKDFSGELSVAFGDKDSAFFSFAKNQAVFSVNVFAGHLAYHIYETTGKMVVASKDEAFEERDASVLFTSQFMDKVLVDILGRQKPALPDIFEATLSHEILFAFMKHHGLANTNIT